MCLGSTAAAQDTVDYYTSPFEVKKILEEHCRSEYSATCLKADVAALVPPISSQRSFRLLPGLVLEMGGFPSALPKAKSIDVGTIDNTLDRYLVKGMDGFINSLTLRVKVMDKSVADAVKRMGITVGQEAMTPDTNDTMPRDNTGRRRRINNALMMGGMVSAGTLLALTMSAVSAMAGKAVLISLISLAMSLMSSRGGGGNDHGGKVSYEIVHTAPQHDDYLTRVWAQTDPVAEAYQHLVKPIAAHLGGKRIGYAGVHR
ncbi:Protein of unknown function (DUF1676) [Nesidiocoris tenuis]|uniref:Uncharacterized protein n=1 Tax=Nesidiocoris tenuis TaxID=355587 RepID=A0ABN7AZU5_9HEMI|nr:Protein of unknown function (DUF1676) [Nesidiocoris tenuis]